MATNRIPGGVLGKRNERISRSLSWVLDHPDVRETARSAGRAEKMAMPDALAADPKRVAQAARSLTDAASKAGAPAPVVKTLVELAARYDKGVKRLPHLTYSVELLGSLVGKRDREEIEPVLLAAAETAPDDANREKIKQMVALARRPPGFDVGFPWPGGVFAGEEGGDDGGCDWGCCVFTCIMCTEACVLCCIAACILC